MKNSDKLGRIIPALALILAPALLHAQEEQLSYVNIYDANNFAATAINGSARFMGVGGSMGAVGGDASALTVNPAGIGVFRSSEVSLSVNGNWNNTTMGDAGRATVADFNLQSVSYVGTWNYERTNGLVNLNINAGFNRIKNFNRQGVYSHNGAGSATELMAAISEGQAYTDIGITESGKDPYLNEDVGWLPIMSYNTGAIWRDTSDVSGASYLGYPTQVVSTESINKSTWFRESGYINEFNFAIGGNISNLFYFGMSFVCNVLDYNQYTEYKETWSTNGNMTHYNSYSAKGTGFTYRVGVMFKPVNWLRIGGAYHTPTWYSINSRTGGNMTTFINGDESSTTTSASTTTNRNYVAGPMKAVASLGFVIGRYSFINVDYIYENYRGISIKDNLHIESLIMSQEIQNNMRDRHSIRTGIEFKPISALAIRLGGGYSWSTMNDDASRLYIANDVNTGMAYYNDRGSYYVSCGLGYNIGRHAFDIAYVWQVNNAMYYAYGNYRQTELALTPISLRSVHNNIVFTYSVRF